MSELKTEVQEESAGVAEEIAPIGPVESEAEAPSMDPAPDVAAADEVESVAVAEAEAAPAEQEPEMVVEANSGQVDEVAPSSEPPGDPLPESAAPAVPRELASHADPVEPGPASPSPDGKWLAYLQDNLKGEGTLWICPIEDGPLRGYSLPFLPDKDDEGPRWSPDNRSFLLTGRTPGIDRRLIWQVDAESGESTPLLRHEADDSDPRWSPDGSTIAFVTTRSPASAISLVNSDGTGLMQLTAPSAGQFDSSPTWSNDGSRIAFRRVSTEGDISGDHIWTISLGSGEQKLITKKLGDRHDLQWMPGREQIAYVTGESEWVNVGVVNPDNQSTWNLCSESGDKNSPAFSPDGKRMLYIRRHQGVARLCERSTSGASADLLDPGDGEASAPAWIDADRIVYRFSPADGETRFVVQAPKKGVERSEILPAVPWSVPEGLIKPSHVEIDVGGGHKFGARLYSPKATKAKRKARAALFLQETPYEPQNGGYRPIEQALAAAGFYVLAPSLAGTPGYGRKVTHALRASTAPDSELSNLVSLVAYLRSLEGVNPNRVSVAGVGYGAALALLMAGGRPGSVCAIAVVDPVIDLALEFEQGSEAWREWQVANLGLPFAQRGRLSLRSPETFAATIDAPVLLIESEIGSPSRREPLGRFEAALVESDVSFERQTTGKESRWDTGNRIVRFLTELGRPS